MMGPVTRTERGRWRFGSRHSPANTATYSKPVRAPNVILLKTLTPNKVKGGATRRKGWYSASVPFQRFKNGSAMSTAMVRRKTALPTLLIHLPIPRPRPAMHMVVAMTANEARTIIHLLDPIQAAPGITEDANETVSSPPRPTYKITYSQRFQATRNPIWSLKAIRAHS